MKTVQRTWTKRSRSRYSTSFLWRLFRACRKDKKTWSKKRITGVTASTEAEYGKFRSYFLTFACWKPSQYHQIGRHFKFRNLSRKAQRKCCCRTLPRIGRKISESDRCAVRLQGTSRSIPESSNALVAVAKGSLGTKTKTLHMVKIAGQTPQRSKSISWLMCTKTAFDTMQITWQIVSRLDRVLGGDWGESIAYVLPNGGVSRGKPNLHCHSG